MRRQLFQFSFLLISIISFSNLYSQKRETEKIEFNITLSETNFGIELKCSEGCAWTELNFEQINGQEIDNLGLVKDSNVKDPEDKKFFFRITRNKDNIRLKGLAGTDWSELSFLVKKNRQYIITRSGVKEKKS